MSSRRSGITRRPYSTTSRPSTSRARSKPSTRAHRAPPPWSTSPAPSGTAALLSTVAAKPSASSARSARPKRAVSRPPGTSPRSAPNAPRCFWRAGHGKSTPLRTRFHLRRRPLQGAPRNLLTNAAIVRCGGHFMPEANRHYAARARDALDAILIPQINLRPWPRATSRERADATGQLCSNTRKSVPGLMHQPLKPAHSKPKVPQPCQVPVTSAIHRPDKRIVLPVARAAHHVKRSHLYPVTRYHIDLLGSVGDAGTAACGPRDPFLPEPCRPSMQWYS